MELVLDTPSPPDARAREKGDVVLMLGAYVALAAIVLAAAWVVQPPPAPAAAPARAIPFAGAWPGGYAAGWSGGSFGANGLVVAAQGANGAVATIEGGSAWRDYTLRARLRWVSGRAVSLHVRDAGPADFVACVLDGPTARVDEVTGGVARTLASAPAPAYAGSGLDAVVVVSGDRVAFSVDGATLVSATLRASARGTAGLAVWDESRGRARLEAEYVRVERAAVPASAVRTTPSKPSAEERGGGE